MDYAKLASVINGAVKEQISATALALRLGTVQSASGSTVRVVVDGSTGAATMIKACACSQGDRVVILRQGTQFFAIGRVGGG